MKMDKEFNLSEKIWGIEIEQNLSVRDVKEFIRLLKGSLMDTLNEWKIDDDEVIINEIGKIDKLAGEKLI